MKILVTGSEGILGSEIKKLSKSYNFDWVFTNRKQFNISNISDIPNVLTKIKPDLIINCAAYTDVDSAEKFIEIAYELNFFAVEAIAKWSIKNKCKLIQISTDYVFDGNLSRPLTEDDKPNPIGVYGQSKYLGEKSCSKFNPASIIIRTSRLFSQFGNNFLKNILKLMNEKNSLDIVDDQFSSPTYAYDLAITILHIISSKNWIPGTYHYCNNHNISWFEYALLIRKISNSKEYYHAKTKDNV